VQVVNRTDAPINPFDEFIRHQGEGNPGFAPPNAPDQGPMQSLASGFFISNNGEIVT
jgi:S1-C subfamily serine protease